MDDCSKSLRDYCSGGHGDNSVPKGLPVSPPRLVVCSNKRIGTDTSSAFVRVSKVPPINRGFNIEQAMVSSSDGDIPVKELLQAKAMQSIAAHPTIKLDPELRTCLQALINSYAHRLEEIRGETKKLEGTDQLVTTTAVYSSSASNYSEDNNSGNTVVTNVQVLSPKNKNKNCDKLVPRHDRSRSECVFDYEGGSKGKPYRQDSSKRSSSCSKNPKLLPHTATSSNVNNKLKPWK